MFNEQDSNDPLQGSVVPPAGFIGAAVEVCPVQPESPTAVRDTPSGGHHEGASPSNTAPANYDDGYQGVRVLRYGVDSLYLSYPGTLSSNWAERLSILKMAARGENDWVKASSQVELGSHLFEILPKGVGRFSYVLVDNHFHLSISSPRAKQLPLAYIQLSSELLTFNGVEAPEADLRYVVSTLGVLDDAPNVSRIDLCVDFTTNYSLEFPVSHWVTRAEDIRPHYQNRHFSGWQIGRGDIVARLYDKTLEIKKSKKDYLKPLWLETGWDGVSQVWRIEFQFRRTVLKELGVVKVADIAARLSALWGYATHSWLRLTTPCSGGENQSRWPTHPMWQTLSQVEWNGIPVTVPRRVRKERLPNEHFLYTNGLAAVTSLMAMEGIRDPIEGFERYVFQAKRYHDMHGRYGKDFLGYLQHKIREKGKRYNTIRNNNQKLQKLTDRQTQHDAKAYVEGKDGEL